MMPRQEYTIRPLSPERIDAEENRLREISKECNNCGIPDYLKADYCSIGICVKDFHK